MTIDEDTRKAHIDQLAGLFETYVSEERTRMANETAFLLDVLESRAGGVYELNLANVEEATIFALDEIKTYFGGGAVPV
jgi:hypothetical protein